AAKREGRAIELPPLPVQYADYAAWQRRWLEGGELERQLQYWKRQLEGAPPVLELPLDFPRPPVKGERGQRVPVTLDDETMRGVRRLARDLEATPFMVMLAAWQLLLMRRARAEEVVVGAPIAGRRHADVDGLIGFFVNTLPLRLDAGGDPSFSALVGRARTAALDGYAHQDVPFERVVAELDVPRDTSVTPVFQATFTLQEESEGTLLGASDAPGWSAEVVELADAPAKFDLSLEMGSDGHGALLYDADLFAEATAGRIASQWAALLARAVTRPETRSSELDATSPEEAAQLLRWSAPLPAISSDPRSIPERIVAQAARAPERLAIADAQGEVSYGEMVRRASALAGRLQARGLGPESRVALVMSPGAAYVTSALGVMLARGAYVSLDPAHPPARLRFMIEDSGAEVVLSDASTRETLRALESEGLAVPTLDADLALAPTGDAPLTAPALSSLAHAYVIYTSGTTGRPKGVAIEHGALRNLCDWYVDGYDVEPDDRVTQIAGLGFDATIFEIWPALSGGASLHVPDADGRRDVGALFQFLRERAITLAFVSTPLIEAAMRTESLEGLALRAVITGGDRLHRRDGAPLPFRLMNHYGPTENTVVSTWCEAPGDDAEPPIGAPLPGTSAHVVDPSSGLPVPVGALGELVVGGAQLARGYLGRPRETAARFVPNPWSERPGERLYRTGDLSAWSADGQLMFHGRIDHQVKLRGQRVELGDIESVLQDAPGVRQAVAVVRSDTPGVQRLVAYVVGDGIDDDALRAHAERWLPAHMVPAAWVSLDALPLTPNGKVDRRALPAPSLPEGATGGPPETDTERALARVFGELLGVEQVGRGDDFFRLGGHSLLATRMISMLRERLGVELPLREVFSHHSLAALAAAIDGAQGERLPPIERAERDEALPLSYAQERLWFLQVFRPESSSLNLSSHLDVTGVIDADGVRAAVVDVVERHEIFRTIFFETKDGPRARIRSLDALPPTFRYLDLRGGADDDARDRLTRELLERPFDLAAEPPLRAGLIHVADDRAELLVCVHHIAADGWTMANLTREVIEAYDRIQASAPPPPPPAPQYVDYAVWQRAHLGETQLAGQLAYWRDALADLEPLELPTDRRRPPVQSARGASLEARIDPALFARLRTFAADRHVTPYAVVLTALDCVLARLGGTEDVAVGTPIAGRRAAETEDMLGCFLNTLVQRVRVRGRDSFADLVDEVSRVNLAAQENQDVPFERVIKELAPRRDLSRTPFFQVFFNYLETLPQTKLERSGLALDLQPPRSVEAKFDLELYVAPTEDHGLKVEAVYCADLFDPPTIERLLASVLRVLREGLDDPARTAMALTDEAPPRVEASPPAPPPLIETLRLSLARHAERAAILWNGAAVTYAQLEDTVKRLAPRVDAVERRSGRVGLVLHKGPEMVVGPIAAFWAGRAYVALDATYPEERLAYMARHADLDALLCTPETAALAGRLAGDRPVLDMSELAPSPMHEPAAVEPTDEAYVLYTSGSTGQPKGVVQTHGAMAHYVDVYARRLGLGPEDRLSLFSAFSFDAAISDTFGAIATGGAVCPYPIKEKGLEGVPAFIEEAGLTIYHSTPTVLRALMDTVDDPQRLRGLRALVLGGEPVLPSDLERFKERFPRGARFINNLGASECSISLWTELDHDTRLRGRMPMGAPVERTRVRLLDDDLRDSFVGQLVVQSDFLAVGYLHDAERSARVFGEFEGRPAYFSGDIAYARPDGQLVSLGRRDGQVKVRGNRIELGEVESAMMEHPRVRRAVASLQPGPDGAPLLVAHVEGDEGLSRDDVRAHLRERLPTYMIPTRITMMARLPLTPSGKIDRAALPAEAGETRAFEAPRAGLEAELAQIVSLTLGVGDVGRDANFFDDLGGDSLTLVRVANRVAEHVGRPIPVVTFFEAPTVATLAVKLGATAEADAPRPSSDRRKARKGKAASRRQRRRRGRREDDE
ncbi:MAG: amino acid adenylation domain-containing protein, partial [Myxococcota bacterium]|nr:amino acid adenylation domain-containing protein [Myxococcota bacterium]